MSIASCLSALREELPESVSLVAVSKFQPCSAIQEAYDSGQRLFAESRVQELLPKYENLPKDIEWHFIGHLQVNKAKYLVPFVSMIQSVDSLRLMEELNRRAGLERRLRILIQIHIGEEHKFGFSFEEADALISGQLRERFPHLIVAGLMGMATFTDDRETIRREFASLSAFFARLKARRFSGDADFKEISMGMSGDYACAIAEGSTMVRIGSKLFGDRPLPV
jgi:pyridoxal phosphate enzyme (YggS family)